MYELDANVRVVIVTASEKTRVGKQMHTKLSLVHHSRMIWNASRYEICDAGTGHSHHNMGLDNLTGCDIEKALENNRTPDVEALGSWVKDDVS